MLSGSGGEQTTYVRTEAKYLQRSGYALQSTFITVRLADAFRDLRDEIME